ncbi:MAG: hypothetical protein JNJ54_31210 [Myxococcaceae bacterium]|nr:hypothetical protein [Myxococcaceae bacterium]
MHALDAHLPSKVTTPDEAAQLWWALIDAGISFHPDDNPGDWVKRDGSPCLTEAQARSVGRLLDQAAGVPESDDAALGALRLALLLGPNALRRLSPAHLSRFADCPSAARAKTLVRRLSRKPANHEGLHHAPVHLGLQNRPVAPHRPCSDLRTRPATRR